MNTVKRTTTLIIGAGQAGLAMSHCLSEQGIEHVVLERGKLAQRWRSHSWDSLKIKENLKNKEIIKDKTRQKK